MEKRILIKIILPVVTILLLITYFSCKSPVGPVDLTPGRRDYTWTVDTLSGPWDPIYRIWGSSPTDLWAITSGGDIRNSIYHFDGTRWTTGKYIIHYGLFSIYGFSQNNVYIGAQNRIYRFDGVSWKETAVLTKDGHDYDIVFDNMWGESLWGPPTALFAFGAYPDDKGLANNSVIALFNFRDNKWSMLNTNGLKGIVEELYRNKPDNRIYLRVIKYSNTFDSTFIYEYNNPGKYTELYKTILSNQGAYLSLINGEVYFVLKTEIATRIGNRFQAILKLDGTNFSGGIWGRNLKDIFLTMTDGLAHYNGNDIKYLFHFDKPNTYTSGAVLFDKEVFFLVYEFQTSLSLIYHGKLN